MPRQTNETDRYYHVDTTHGSFNAMKSSSETRHRANAPGTNLSVTLNLAGTEALVKVRGGKNWNPGWLNAPFVLRVFTADELPLVWALIYTPEWTPTP